MSQTNARAAKTDATIKDAMLSLLSRKPYARISVAELAREAKVSRSTFYQHFTGIADVFDALVRDVQDEVRPFVNQLGCHAARCMSLSFNANNADVGETERPSYAKDGVPYCVFVRHAGKYAPLVKEPQFADYFVSCGVEEGRPDLMRMLEGAGYSAHEAEVIFRFQMAGCFAAARACPGDDALWDKDNLLIDQFIIGGLRALGVHARVAASSGACAPSAKRKEHDERNSDNACR